MQKMLKLASSGQVIYGLRMNELSTEILRTFVTVVDAGSFSAAARRLNTTQPSISRRVTQLENTLGIVLFQRSTRRIALTEAGRIYLDRIRAVLEDLDDATQAVQQIQAEPNGLIRVSAPATLGQRLIAPLLPAFRNRYPKIDVGLFLSDNYRDLIGEGYDVAIRFGAQQDSTLVARRLTTSQSLICASPGYLRNAQEIREPADLSRHNCLMFRQSPGQNTWHFIRGNEDVSVSVSGSLFSDTADALISAAIAGLGIVHLPDWLVGDALKQGKLVRLLAGWNLMPRQTPIFAVYPSRRYLAPKISVFNSFLAGAFAKEEWGTNNGT